MVLMDTKTAGGIILAGVLILLAIGGYFYWQKSVAEDCYFQEVQCIRAPCPPRLVCKETSTLQPFQSVDYGVALAYPEFYKVSEPAVFYLESPLLALSTPENFRPGTNLVDGILTLSTGAASGCYRGINDPSRSLTEQEKIGGVVFYKDTMVGAAAGNTYDSQIYRTVQNSRCYEAVLTVHTGNIGNYEPGTVSEVDKIDIFVALRKVLENISFTQI